MKLTLQHRRVNRTFIIEKFGDMDELIVDFCKKNKTNKCIFTIIGDVQLINVIGTGYTTSIGR